jgi:hypothetical protein
MRLPRTLAVLVGSVAVGLGLGWFLHASARSRRDEKDRSQDQLARAERADSPAAASPLDRLRLQSLEAKVSALEAGSSAKVAPPPPAPALHHPTPEEREATIEEDYRNHQELIRKTTSLPRTEPWATEMEQRIADGFKRVPADMKGKLEGSECRTSSCIVRVSWPSRQTAEGGMMALMGLTGGTGCARQVALPPANGDEDQAMESTVVLDCTSRPPPAPPPH